MITCDGWARNSIWGHSAPVRDLYRRRCLKQAEEMDAHAQAAELLAERTSPGDVVLDAGCGSGYFFHSLTRRNPGVEYLGVDSCRALLDIGRETLPAFGLSAGHLIEARLEDIDGTVDHVVCINVLSNIDNYHRPLERLLKMARKSVILRESIKHGAEYSYVADRYLDTGVNLKVHVNHYDSDDITAFARSYGYNVVLVTDRRSGGRPEMVIDHPHYWTFLVADRQG